MSVLVQNGIDSIQNRYGTYRQRIKLWLPVVFVTSLQYVGCVCDVITIYVMFGSCEMFIHECISIFVFTYEICIFFLKRLSHTNHLL